jgi:hypothetical protein
LKARPLQNLHTPASFVFVQTVKKESSSSHNLLYRVPTSCMPDLFWLACPGMSSSSSLCCLPCCQMVHTAEICLSCVCSSRHFDVSNVLTIWADMTWQETLREHEGWDRVGDGCWQAMLRAEVQIKKSRRWWTARTLAQFKMPVTSSGVQGDLHLCFKFPLSYRCWCWCCLVQGSYAAGLSIVLPIFLGTHSAILLAVRGGVLNGLMWSVPVPDWQSVCCPWNLIDLCIMSLPSVDIKTCLSASNFTIN